MRGWLLALVAVGCKGDAPPSSAATKPLAVAPVPASPAVQRLVVAAERTAQLVEIGSAARIIETVALPSTVEGVVWIGRDPIALLVAHAAPGEAAAGQDLDGTVGALTGSGFVAMPRLPASTWTRKPREGTQKLEQARWGLIASTSGELWLGRCDWGGYADGMTICDDWLWARLGGPFALSSVTSPEFVDVPHTWPTVAPSSAVAISFAPIQDHADRFVMTCRAGSATTTFPDDPNEDDSADRTSVNWLSTDPPMFAVDEVRAGFEVTAHTTVFEGCEPSNRFGEATGYSGPAGLFVLASTRAASLRRDGKELLALPGAERVVFAPERPALPATDAFSILERQLGGDMSMLAPDAIVLGALPRSIAAARIDSFETNKAGAASWLAAELRLDGEIYRSIELIDEQRHVIVASFAPLKPLVRSAAPLAVTSPNASGPLAAMLAAPASAAATLRSGTVFGTEPDEHGEDSDARDLLGRWAKLQFALDPAAREVHVADYGYAIASVALARPGGPPLRMRALVIGTLDNGTWKIDAIHYIAP
jgi:hypothetical protein